MNCCDFLRITENYYTLWFLFFHKNQLMYTSRTKKITQTEQKNSKNFILLNIFEKFYEKLPQKVYIFRTRLCPLLQRIEECILVDSRFFSHYKAVLILLKTQTNLYVISMQCKLYLYELDICKLR